MPDYAITVLISTGTNNEKIMRIGHQHDAHNFTSKL